MSSSRENSAIAMAPEAVQRLAGGGGQGGFLGAHHVEAATRLSALFERSRMRQRVTMSYDPGRVGSGRPMQGELADSAADARRRLTQLARQTPGDCWGVVSDVCSLDLGLQEIETARGWPRRSAKLVLRIGLDHLALALGLDDAARGDDRAGLRHWLPERPPMFADKEASLSRG